MSKVDTIGTDKYHTDCRLCGGSGEMIVANGPDDFDLEPCSYTKVKQTV